MKRKAIGAASARRNALNCGEHNEAFTEGVGGHVTPVNGPVDFASNTAECVNSLKKTCSMSGHSCWDQHCGQQKAGLCLSIFNDLETISKAVSFG